MTFLNPLLLFGLAAASIPIILHLLNLRKLRIIEFSTLTFLKELQLTKLRRLKLRQILLLITRTLLIIFIVLAFARPALRGTYLGNLGTQAHSSIVLILDDSFSMTGGDEGGERFKQAKEITLKIIDLLRDGDEVFLIKLSDIPRATINPATHDFTTLRNIIRESQPTTIYRSMTAGVHLSAKLLAQSLNANKEVYIVSDLQKSLFSEEIRSQDSSASYFDERTAFFLIPMGEKEIPNAAIDSLHLATTILEKDKPALVSIFVRNFSPAPISNHVVSVYIDGIRTAQKNISLESWGSASADFTVIPKHTGFLKGYVDLENDAIEPDNRRYFTLYIPPQIKIGLFSNSENDYKFLLLACKASSDETGGSSLNVQIIPSEKSLPLDMKQMDVLTCLNVKRFTPTDIEKLINFVKHGGGLLLFPGDNSDLDNLSELLRSLNIPPVNNIIRASTGSSDLTLGKVDIDHPLFSTIFEKEMLHNGQLSDAIGSLTVFKTIDRTASREARTIISLSNGKPFLTEHSYGNGKILFFSVAPTLSWSDLPMKAIFAPLIHRSMMYLTGGERYTTPYLTGDQPTITIRNISTVRDTSSPGARNRYHIVLPDGMEEIVQPIMQPERTLGLVRPVNIIPQQLRSPGFYSINNGAITVELLAVNVNHIESDTRMIPENELTESLQLLGIQHESIIFIHPGDQIKATILETRFGVELWKYFGILALLMALIEMFIARDNRKAIQGING